MATINTPSGMTSFHLTQANYLRLCVDGHLHLGSVALPFQFNIEVDTMSGSVEFREKGSNNLLLTIEPDGSVSSVKLLSSELGDADLERKLLARIRMIDFGAASVGRTTLKYAFDFLPF